MNRPRDFLTHELLATRGVPHGFGLRGSRPPPGLLRPRQVHGAEVVQVGEAGWREPPAADAIICAGAAATVGVATADCVAVLLSTASGGCVAAVHAGWRGLARGVVAAAVAKLCELAPDDRPFVAAMGPYIGPCCYEIDSPVVAGLELRFAEDLGEALRPSRPGHEKLDLGLLVRRDLERSGLGPSGIGALEAACTCCDAERFHSYRRDGPRAGRLVHFVAARSVAAGRGSERPTPARSRVS